MNTQIRTYYRKHDGFNRYLVKNRRRVHELTELYRKNGRYFGRRVLDLACGGGILGFIIEPHGHSYVGIDINPDMINSARAYAKRSGSKDTFIEGDTRSAKVKGTFDTVTLLGNALIHFSTESLFETLKGIQSHVHKGTFFITDYRDVVSMLYSGKWSKKYADMYGKRSVLSLTEGIDTRTGELLVRSESERKHNLDFRAAIWSPFIMATIMHSNGWTLKKRETTPASDIWLEVYRKK